MPATAQTALSVCPTARPLARWVRALMLAACTTALPTLPALSQVRAVETVGRATQTGVAAPSELRRRALEDALYQAAMAAGARVQGYSAVAGAALVSERLVVRPEARILDYAILSEKNEGGVVEIHLRAHVGALPEAAVCASTAPVEIALWSPHITLAPEAPAWLQTVAWQAGARLAESLAANPAVRLVRIDGPPPSAPDAGNPNGGLDPAFTYAALVGGTRPRGFPAHHLSMHTTISLGREPERAGGPLMLHITSRLIAPDGTTAKTEQTRAEAGTGPRTPWRTLDRLAGRDRAALAADLLAAVDAHAASVIAGQACRPLEGNLRAQPDGTYTLPLGSLHGIGRQHLAYTEGAQTPYTLLEVVTLSERAVTLRPIDPGRDPAALDGARARLFGPGS